MLSDVIDKLWYQSHPLRWLLYPLSLVFSVISRFRRYIFINFFQQSYDVPIIVVGNLTVGGVGKTPLVITLANAMTQKGIRVGIVSRGYGSSAPYYPYLIDSNDTASVVGDEPLLIAEKTNCPVVISANRNQSVKRLIAEKRCQVIISDDGLQHYKMGRQIEMVVIDGFRGLGNGLQLPAGPLREPASRLEQVDFILVNSGEWPGAYSMQLLTGALTTIKTSKKVAIEDLSLPVAAVAGIGNPARFFDTLNQLGLSYNPYPFPDHYEYKKEDFRFSESFVLMTEKDAVKCRSFAENNMMYLPVDVKIDGQFWNDLWKHTALKDLVSYEK